MKKSTVYIICGLTFISLVILLLATFLEMRTEGTECLINPLVYGVKQVEESNDAYFICSCSISKPNSPTILLDNKGLSLFESSIITEFPIIINTKDSTNNSNSN